VPRKRLVVAAVAVSLVAVGCESGGTGDAQGAAGTPAMQGMGNYPPDASGPQVPAGVAQFAVDPFWPQPLPENWILGQVAGQSVDSDDNVWIIHRPWSAQAMNAGSTPLQTTRDRTWGHDPLMSLCCVTAPPDSPTGEYQWFNGEHGIHVDHNDFVWVAGNGANDHHMLKFTMDGEFVLQIGMVGESEASNDPNYLNGVAVMEVDPETNEIYVADGGRLVVFDAETGEFLRHWGAYGQPPVDGETGRPSLRDPNAPPSRTWSRPVHGMAITDDGLVFVADRPNNRIQVFQKDGSYVTETVLQPQTFGLGSTDGVELDPLDTERRFIYVPDAMDNKIWTLDRETLEVVYSWGRGRTQPGQFDWLHYIAFDSQGNMYTGEVQTGHRIQKFVRLNGAP